MYLEVQALGETLMRRDMLRFADQLAVPAEGLMAAGVVVRRAIEDQFDTEGAHASGGWKALAASTVAEKARKGLDPHILRATDRLKESLTRKFDSDNIERLEGPEAMVFGSSVPYGGLHQTGTRKMPRRRPVALTEADKVEIMKAIQFGIVRGVRAASGAVGGSGPSPLSGPELWARRTAATSGYAGPGVGQRAGASVFTTGSGGP